MMRTFSCDIETDGLNPTVVWCVAVQDVVSKQVITFSETTLGLFKPWLVSEVDCLVFHNGIDFDVPVLERLLDIDFSSIEIEDTLVLSQLDVPRREGGHSLASWGERLKFDQVDNGESLHIQFNKDVIVESVAIVAGKGVCGGFYQMGKAAPLAVYCVDADNDVKTQEGIISDLGVLQAGQNLKLSSSPHYGVEASGQWRLGAITVRVLK